MILSGFSLRESEMKMRLIKDALKAIQLQGDRAGLEALSGPARRLIEYGCDKGVKGSPSQLYM